MARHPASAILLSLALLAAGCPAPEEGATTHRPDLEPGAEHSLTIEGEGLNVYTYSDARTIYGDGVICVWDAYSDDSAAYVDVLCEASAATRGLAPSDVIRIYGPDRLVASVVLDARR